MDDKVISLGTRQPISSEEIETPSELCEGLTSIIVMGYDQEGVLISRTQTGVTVESANFMIDIFKRDLLDF